mmetsp:Transcript_97014/g.259183  ORF Transcript_97014/g.259183 Transcript_97014/m.259183 type:complete len:278 (-) Transcript_97014:2495-3328(-)
MSRQGKKYGASSSCSMVKCASGDNTVASGTTLRQSRKSCRPAPLGNTSNSCLPSDPRDPKPSRIRSLRSVRQVDADSSRISKDNALGWKVGSTNVVEGWEDQLHGLVVHHAANRGISHSAPHCVDWVYVLLNIGVRTTSTPTEAAHAHTCRIRHSSEKHSCCCSSATPGESSENRCRPPRSQEEKSSWESCQILEYMPSACHGFRLPDQCNTRCAINSDIGSPSRHPRPSKFHDPCNEIACVAGPDTAASNNGAWDPPAHNGPIRLCLRMSSRTASA